MSDQSSTITNIVFIDASVPDYQTLIAGLPNNSTYFVLDAQKDGVAQIEQYLAGYSNLDSIQIFSHGSQGSLYLGNAVLSNKTLKQYQDQLANIGSHLKDTGDILLYGCNVAQGDIGLQFIDDLAKATGTDVAASNDITGSAALGGNGQLEVSTGSIEALPAFTAVSQQSYGSVLLADDYADNTATTGRVTVGGSVTGIIDLVNDADWFKVDLAAGTRYVFDLSGLDSGGGTLGANSGTPYLKIYDPQGSYTYGGAYSGGIGGDPRTSYTPTISGTYYLEASELGNDQTGTYTLKASVAATTDDYAGNTTTTGRVTIGGSVTGIIDLVNDADWFKVDLVAGTRYIFDLSGLDSGGGTLGANSGTPYLKIYDPQGSYTYGGTYSGGIGGDPRTSYTPTISGTYYLEASELGNDQTGTYTLITIAANTINGDTNNNTINGTNANDLIQGLAGDDILNGGLGNDILEGGDGSDSYFVDNAGDVVTETNSLASTGGTDLVYSYLAAYTLGANVENGRILATGAANLSGNTLNNVIYAGSGINSIDGLAGTDTLSYQYATTTGAVGVTLNLSALNASGQSTASGISGADLIKGIENIIGSNYNDTFTGNAGNNILSGLAGNDSLNGGLGADKLTGGKGQDNLTGGAGRDTFTFAAGDDGITAATLDKILDYAKGVVGTGDLIDYSANLTKGGNANIATASQASINQSTGIATFANGSGTTLADALNDITARLTAATNTAGEFACFKINNTGNYYLFVSDGTAGAGVNDDLIQLVGVTSISAIDLTGGNLTIIS